LVYITIEKGLFSEQTTDETHVKVANNVEEAAKVLKVCFEYVTATMAMEKIFQKHR